MLRPVWVPKIGGSEPFLLAFHLYRHRETPGEIQKAVDFLSRLYLFNYLCEHGRPIHRWKALML